MKNKSRYLSFLVGLLFLLLFLSNLTHANQPSTEYWQDVDESSFSARGERWIIPDEYRTLSLDYAGIQALLAQAPMEFTTAARIQPLEITLPMPDGSWQRFNVFESPIMADELAAKYPYIKSYAGQGVEDTTATIRFDVTPQGFHAMIISPNGTIYIDPYSSQETERYISYNKADFRSSLQIDPDIVLDELGAKEQIHEILAQKQLAPSGDELRTYRLAVAATGEYTVFHGGTVAAGQAAIVTAINRVTGIYENEVAVRFELIPNNDVIVYTNAATDPYTNSSGFTMLGQNQSNLNSVIGAANYDVGHVFSTGGGGVASLGVVCNNNNKARGVTGLSSPTGDPFYVDYVAHEIGHQYGGNHTFNGNAGSCAGGNRNGPTAYEPGSGNTIMAYAGICGSQNLQNNSDDYFHTESFDEIVAFTTNGGGNNCAAITNTGNNVPVPDAGTGGFTIPKETPFTLTGSATDADGDTLTYNWEEYDLGPAAGFNSTNPPYFRSWLATLSPSRTFPRLSDLVNNASPIGEDLPSVTDTLTFRMTARDNKAGGGGVDYDTITFDVTSSAGPFLVTAPNSAVSWTGGAMETVSWDVANTTASPVSCANVDILLSTDGGFSYPTTILSGTPNDGSQSITVPNLSTTTARIKVVCSDNIFFDISNVDFTIAGGTDDFTVDASPGSQSICLGSNAIYNITVGQVGGFTDPVTLSAVGNPGSAAFAPNGNNVPYNSVLTISGAAAGSYNFDIEGDDGSTTHTTSVGLEVVAGAPSTPSLLIPANGASGISTSPAFNWSDSGGGSYDIEIATDALFSNIVDSANVATNSYNGASLAGGETYHWRVRANNGCGSSAYSNGFNFTTIAGTLVCAGSTVSFESGLPSDWSPIVTNGPVLWGTTADTAVCNSSGNQTNGSGEAACADSRLTNSGGADYDLELRTNTLDLSNSNAITLTFEAAYNFVSSGEGFDVDISTNGGTNWSNLLSWNSDHTEEVSLDLSAYAGNNAIIRYRYFGDARNGIAHIDDVSLSCSCSAPGAPSNVTVAAAVNGMDTELSWSDTGDNMYQVWRAVDDPYFNPGDPGSVVASTSGTSYTHVGGIGDPSGNNYYLVANSCGSGGGVSYDRKGEFDFAITLGTP